MADGANKGGRKPASKPRGTAKRKPPPKLTPAEKRRREAARRKTKAQQAEAERVAGLSPAQLVQEADARLTGPAQTIERAQTYKELMRDWARGYTHADLAAKHGISESRVKQIVESLRGSRLSALGIGDSLFAVKFAQDLVLQKATAVSEYARMADETSEQAPHVKLGFLKQRDAALDRLTDLMQELGWLPKNLGTLSVQMDAMQMAEVMLDVMEDHGVDHGVQQAIVEAIELRVVRREGRLSLSPGGVVDVEDAMEVQDDGQPGESAEAAA